MQIDIHVKTISGDISEEDLMEHIRTAVIGLTRELVKAGCHPLISMMPSEYE